MPAPLESWSDGAAKSAIVDFVTKVTTAGGPDFVPPAERIATFDNDGTLWLEKPLYIQLQHGLRAIGKAAAEKPELRDRQPFKAVYEKDMAWLGKAAADYAKGDSSGVFTLVAGLTEVLEGITVEAFEADVLDFLSNAQDAHFKEPYKQFTYKPMVELVHYLQDNDFQVYITSGGGRDFMRAVCEEIYNIPRAMTIGSSVTFKYSRRCAGCCPGDAHQRDRAADRRRAGQAAAHPSRHRARPIMAAGNSDGDIHMLKYAGWAQGSLLAGASRRCRARIRLRWRLGKGAATGGARGLDRRQHEERLEDRVFSRPL